MKKIIIYTDGGSRGNPGKAAIGVVFCNEKGDAFKEYAEYLGDNITNNEAEYKAVITALKKFKAVFGKKIADTSDVELRSDSELMVKQLKGEYKILEPRIQQLFIEVWNLKTDFKKIHFTAISRDKNQKADKLVNQALDGEGSVQKLF